MTTKDKILIIGLGMMGGSYAMALVKKGFTVWGIDSDPKTLDWALEKGLIHKGAVMATHKQRRASGGLRHAEELVRKADTIIFSLYPNSFLPWLREHSGLVKKGALVTDMLGVKGGFVEEAQELLSPGSEFIATHPMAGSEKSGVQHANDAIFIGANFIITPTKENTPVGMAFARELAALLGFGRITELTVEEHDNMIGYVSQLTHVIAICLMKGNRDPRLPEVTGDSFRDLTRIADINTTLWSELFFANGPVLVKQMGHFIDCMEELRRRLANDDRIGLKELLHDAGKRRQQFNKKTNDAHKKTPAQG